MTDHTDENEGQLDPGFRIVDKRQAGKDEESSAEPAGEAEKARETKAAEPEKEAAETPRAEQPPQDAAAPTAEEAAAEEAPPFEPIDAHGLVQFCVSLLRDFAWQRMGLVPDQVTKKIERDLAQARIAIDCVEALLKQVEATVPEAEGHQLHAVLNDLQMNFVRQSSRTE
ncbi:MAG: DUF1844 domain-containing protein [Armatimonadota bacterium]|nr:MAG: DUF1844 domain-containing protein [Armatimonadota bacterium]